LRRTEPWYFHGSNLTVGQGKAFTDVHFHQKSRPFSPLDFSRTPLCRSRMSPPHSGILFEVIRPTVALVSSDDIGAAIISACSLANSCAASAVLVSSNCLRSCSFCAAISANLCASASERRPSRRNFSAEFRLLLCERSSGAEKNGLQRPQARAPRLCRPGNGPPPPVRPVQLAERRYRFR
jgi:hypothetical protein